MYIDTQMYNIYSHVCLYVKESSSYICTYIYIRIYTDIYRERECARESAHERADARESEGGEESDSARARYRTNIKTLTKADWVPRLVSRTVW